MTKKSALRLILCGVQGRMGSRVAALAQADPRFTIAAGVTSRVGSFSIYPYPRVEEKELASYLASCDALIDFSVPDSSVRFAQAAADARKPIVIGVTGFSPAQRSHIAALARRTALFLCPNFSPGMGLVFQFAQRAAAALKGYDIAISEAHHNQKIDAPSGTALKLAESIRRSRPGARIPIVSQRLGTVVGDHVVAFAGPHERIEIIHRAESRDVFARGALEAAWWIRRRKPGLYGMEDFLK